MFTINVEKECGCFKKSSYTNGMTFDDQSKAKEQANLMVSHMNQRFCQTHLFYVEEDGKNLNIGVDMKPKSNDGGCCGGGHCST
jgi:hypothetical protein